MMKNLYITIMLVSCSSVATGYAQKISDSDKALVEKIQQANTKYTGIASRFKQTKHISVLGEDVLSEGHFYYKKPDKLSMQYDQPVGDLMLLNGERFVMVNAGKRMVTSAKANSKMRSMKNVLSNCLAGDVLQLNADVITCEDTKKYNVVIAKFAKSPKNIYTKVVLSFDKSDGSISILRTEEKDGSYTVYELVGKEFNTAMDDTHFQTPNK
ncbi:MAG: outer membrane lipoprotein carrier protein LolA [Bacteroidales bacterium]|jgi:outer membrane lipoprotein-sorting protein|nr:outer membrane lipoprotein carrier protein LolA [Bacteroidales bacterium]